jgi:hypothetical protein
MNRRKEFEIRNNERGIGGKRGDEEERRVTRENEE